MFQQHQPDLFGYIYQQYKKSEPKDPNSLLGFLEYARNYLNYNRVAELTYLAEGMGIKLRDGTILAFTQQQLGTPVMYDDCVRIRGGQLTPLSASIEDRTAISFMGQSTQPTEFLPEVKSEEHKIEQKPIKRQPKVKSS